MLSSAMKPKLDSVNLEANRAILGAGAAVRLPFSRVRELEPWETNAVHRGAG